MGKRIVIHAAAPSPDDPTTMVATGETEIFDTRDLDDGKAEARGRLAAQFNSLVAAGRAVTVAGSQKDYQIDDASRANMTGAAALALASLVSGAPWPDGFYWIAADNSHQPMGAQDCLGFARNIADYYAAMVFVNRAKKDAIAALDTIEACDAYDVTAGWPSNP